MSICIDNIDWALLREQKGHLISVAAGACPDKDILQGVINFLDVVDDLGKGIVYKWQSVTFDDVGGFATCEIIEHLESELELNLTPEEGASFIRHLENSFDAEVGLSWDMIIHHFHVWEGK